MSTVNEVPLIAVAQKLGVTIAGVQYTLTIRWCAPAAAWVMDIADVSDVAIAQGLPLVTGVDLLSQLAYLGIGAKLIVQSDNDANAVPTYTTLGDTGHLYCVTP